MKRNESKKKLTKKKWKLKPFQNEIPPTNVDIKIHSKLIKSLVAFFLSKNQENKLTVSFDN